MKIKSYLFFTAALILTIRTSVASDYASVFSCPSYLLEKSSVVGSELDEWKRILKEDIFYYSPVLATEEDQIFFYVFSQLSPTMRSRILSLPNSRISTPDAYKKLMRDAGVPELSFLTAVQYRMERWYESQPLIWPQSFWKWIEEGMKALDAQDKPLLDYKSRQLAHNSKAINHWRSLHIEIPLYINHNEREGFLKVKTSRFYETHYYATVKDNEIIITVSASEKWMKVSNPAAQETGEKLPKTLNAKIGLDGIIYITDKITKTQFVSLLENQKNIGVKLKIQLKNRKITTTISEHLELIGASQPTLGEVRALYEKRVKLEQIIPAEVIKNITWAELFK